MTCCRFFSSILVEREQASQNIRSPSEQVWSPLRTTFVQFFMQRRIVFHANVSRPDSKTIYVRFKDNIEMNIITNIM